MQKRKLLAIVAVFVLGIPFLGYSNEQNQCLVQKNAAIEMPLEAQNAITDCVKKNNCKPEQYPQICPWALIQEKGKLPLGPVDQDRLDEICEQCRQIALIGCVMDLKVAQTKLDLLSKIFLTDTANDKPLVFGFALPNYSLNNLNISANLAELEKSRTAYESELGELSTKLKPLSNNVKTLDLVRSNIKKSQSAVDAFENKWSLFFNNVAEMEILISRSDAVLSDWSQRLDSLQSDSGCVQAKPEIDKAVIDSASIHELFAGAMQSISKAKIDPRVATLRAFTENAIKLNYLALTKSSVDDLENALGSALKLDSDMSQANRWWFNASVNGLAGNLHTRYYQYREPLRRLYMDVAKGQEYLKMFQTNTTAPKAAVNTAITTQQNRLSQIQSDIKWLEGRGWQGQYKAQVDTARSWIASGGSAPCLQALRNFIKESGSAGSDQVAFEVQAEPVFIEAIQFCEAYQ